MGFGWCSVGSHGERMSPLTVATPPKDTIIFGFDSAWSDKTPGAICALSFDTRGRTSFYPPTLAKFKDALEYIATRKLSFARVIVALDQPTIVPNTKGMRPAERVAASLLSFTGGGVQPAYRGKTAMFGDKSPIWQFKKALRADDDPERARTCDRGLFLVEVFPALALSGLHAPFAYRLGAPKYNPKNAKFRLADWDAVVKAATATANALSVAALRDWCSGVPTLAKPAKSDQDRMDSVICALIGYIWLACDRSVSMLLGDLKTGYIATPVSAATGARLKKAAVGKGVPFK